MTEGTRETGSFGPGSTNTPFGLKAKLQHITSALALHLPNIARHAAKSTLRAAMLAGTPDRPPPEAPIVRLQG